MNQKAWLNFEHTFFLCSEVETHETKSTVTKDSGFGQSHVKVKSDIL